jgi:branched-chain amino acid aminotransferase
MVQELARPAKLQKGAAPDSAWAFLDGKFVPIREANISVMTHAFNYGTGVFEGIRAYWNSEEEQLYGLHLKEHFSRLLRSGKIMRISIPHTADELVATAVELLRKCGYREDAYVRPVAYKSTPVIGVRLHNLDDGLTIFAVPFGNYIEVDKGVACHVSSWRRVDDNAIPARAKITGSYVNAALTHDGHVSEASAANLFLVRDGKLLTAPATDNILEGIVRSSVMRIAADLGVEVEIRSIDRTELYISDEMFMCGTGVQISPVTSVDRRDVGTGEIGPVTKRISKVYFDAVRGKDARYRDWLTPIYKSAS